MSAQRDPYAWVEESGTVEERRMLRHLQAGGNEPAPMFDVAASRFGRFLDSEPSERRMIIPDFLPLNIVALLAAMGGAGKSVLLYLLGLSVATGIPFLGMPVGEVGGVLLLKAEDDEMELHRRGRRLLDHYETIGRVDRGALSDRLHVVSRTADDNMLTAGREGEVSRTPLVDRLVNAALQIPDLKMIAIDPVSRFRGGNANAEADSTRFVEALEVIRAETGALVLASVHVNKASIKDKGDADQSIVRGSTALVDGVRWVSTMTHLRRDAAADYGVEPAEASRYVRLDLVKSNYTRPWPGLWLRREAGGVLVPSHLEPQADARKEAKAEATYNAVLARVTNLLSTEGPMTASKLERNYSGTSGVLGAGLHTVRSVLNRAAQDGDLHVAETGRGRLLDVPGRAA